MLSDMSSGKRDDVASRHPLAGTARVPLGLTRERVSLAVK